MLIVEWEDLRSCDALVRMYGVIVAAGCCSSSFSNPTILGYTVLPGLSSKSRVRSILVVNSVAS